MATSAARRRRTKVIGMGRCEDQTAGEGAIVGESPDARNREKAHGLTARAMMVRPSSSGVLFMARTSGSFASSRV